MATFTITTNADFGEDSLRGAIEKAEAGDTIKFASSLANQTITLSNRQLLVDKNLTIDGIDAPGLTISGNNASRVFYLNSNQDFPTSLTLKNLVVANGYTEERGGGIYATHKGTVTVENVQFNNNVADRGGGAIFTEWETNLKVTGSKFDSNQAIAGNDERGAGAIAFLSPGEFTVKDSEFTNNYGINGGAINSLYGKLTVENSKFLNNNTTAAFFDNGQPHPFLRGYGGAIYTDRASSTDEASGTIRVAGSVFENNRGRGEGGAAYLYTGTQDNVVVESSTFKNNEILELPNGGNAGNGGAVVVLSNGLNQGLTIRDAAFIDNIAANQGGGLWMMDAPTTIANSNFLGNKTLGTDSSRVGGAMALYGPTDIVDTKIVNNHAGWVGGGISASDSANVTVKNTIFADNTADNGTNNWGIQQHTNRELIDNGGNIQWPPKLTNNWNDYNATPSITLADPNLGDLQNISDSTVDNPLGGSLSSGSDVGNSISMVPPSISSEVAPALSDSSPDNVQPIQLGTNLSGIADWSSQLPFLDAFKSSRQWFTQDSDTWDTGEASKLDLDENGWVKSLPNGNTSTEYTQVGTLLNREIPKASGVKESYPGGKYVVLYDGEGKIEYGFDAKLDATASKPGRDVIDVTSSEAGIYLKLTQTDPNGTGNYIRNIRVVPEAYENTYQTQVFNPDFFEKVDDFTTLRFMDWMGTNSSTQGEWSQRPTPTTATYAAIGAPVEVMVDLANKTGNDPWFDIPHTATNEYITNFAKIVKEKLDPDLKVYVELSNEVWNPQFEQYHWAQQQASKQAGADSWLDWYAPRTEQIGDIWDSVFGQESERVVTVLGAQAGNPWVAQEGLKTAKEYDPNSTIDALAITGYVGIHASQERQAEIESWTKEPDGGLNKVFDELNKVALPETLGWVTKHAELAKEYGLDLLGYEGGQHLNSGFGVENNAAITNLFIQANRDSRMGDLYRNLLEGWNEQGGGIFMNFTDIGTPSKWGSWGALEHVHQDSSPKWDALMDFIEQGASETLVATADTATTPANTAVRIDVLANDTPGDNFTLTLVNNPSQGTAQLNDNGTLQQLTDDFILYTPNANVTGTDQFTYQLDTANGSTANATVSVSITPATSLPVPKPPQIQSTLIDLREVDFNGDGQLDPQVQANFSDIISNAGYSDSVGLYVVANAQGAVRDMLSDRLIQPGEADYANVALQQRLSAVEMERNTGTLTTQLETGVMLAPYLIANGTPEQFLAQNGGNQQGIEPHAYFAYLGANPDRTNHVQMLDNQQFGFEDMWGGGDADFNDFTFRLNFQSA